MSPRDVSLVLITALGAAGVCALVWPSRAPVVSTADAATATTAVGGMDPSPQAASDVLPPHHPSIGSARTPHEAMPKASDELPAIGWKMPHDWTEAPNPSTMRLATYRAPNGAELSVTRAGGSVDANIQRWVGQFDAAGAEKRSQRTIHGQHVTVVELSGIYDGGQGMGPSAGARPGWALLAAIVETSGSPYFFKMLGPAAAVKAAHASFDSMLDSLTVL